MTNNTNAEVGCRLVGEFVDDGGCHGTIALPPGEVVPTQVVATYVDLWRSEDGLREFTVLLKDGRSIAIRGNGLKHAIHPVAGEDVYSIVVRNNIDEVTVALFKSSDVAGIFEGAVGLERRIA